MCGKWEGRPPTGPLLLSTANPDPLNKKFYVIIYIAVNGADKQGESVVSTARQYCYANCVSEMTGCHFACQNPPSRQRHRPAGRRDTDDDRYLSSLKDPIRLSCPTSAVMAQCHAVCRLPGDSPLRLIPTCANK